MKKSPLRHPLDCDFLVIAHRGARKRAPENTMAAFKMAHQLKADMIELDVQLSRDGVLVVFHDENLDRCSNGKGWVSSLTFDELQQLDAGQWFSIKFLGEKIPTLQQVVDWASDKIMMNIEIKPEAVSDSPKNGIEEKVSAIVHSAGMEKSVIISSFDYRAIQRIKNIDPEMVTGLLYNRRLSGKMSPVELLDEYGADLFHCSKAEMGKKWIQQLEESRRKFMIYTVNGEKPMRKWIKKGAYGIFSDKPDKLKEVADNFFEKTA